MQKAEPGSSIAQTGDVVALGQANKVLSSAFSSYLHGSAAATAQEFVRGQIMKIEPESGQKNSLSGMIAITTFKFPEPEKQ